MVKTSRFPMLTPRPPNGTVARPRPHLANSRTSSTPHGPPKRPVPKPISYPSFPGTGPALPHLRTLVTNIRYGFARNNVHVRAQPRARGAYYETDVLSDMSTPARPSQGKARPFPEQARPFSNQGRPFSKEPRLFSDQERPFFEEARPFSNEASAI